MGISVKINTGIIRIKKRVAIFKRLCYSAYRTDRKQQSIGRRNRRILYGRKEIKKDKVNPLDKEGRDVL